MAGRDRFINQITVSGDYEVPIEMDYVFADNLVADITITLKRTRDRLIRSHRVEKVDDSAFVVTVTDGANLSYLLSTQGEAAVFEVDVNGDFHVFAANQALMDITAQAATNTLDLASNVVSAETVTIGADVYEIEIVNTDSTDNTAGGDFNNTTDPLVVAASVTYPNVFARGVGDLVRIGTEIMRITAKGATDLTFQRGVSGTTTAAHANALDIFIGDGIAGGSTVAVGLVTTLTPAAFNPALIADINSQGTEPFTASADVNNVVITADALGAAGNGVACSETLTGSGNQWEAALTSGGRDAGTIITNSAPANVLTKSDGTDLVPSRVSDDGSTIIANSGAGGVFDAGDTGFAGNGSHIKVDDTNDTISIENDGASDIQALYLIKSAGVGTASLQAAGTTSPTGTLTISSSAGDAAIAINNVSAFYPATTGTVNLGQSRTVAWKQLFLDATITAGGTTGDQTINKSAGSVNLGAGASSVTVTSNKCTTSSLVFAVIATNDATAIIKNVVPGNGSFVIRTTAAVTAETRVNFWILNQ